MGLRDIFFDERKQQRGIRGSAVFAFTLVTDI
jgi:hypothetical protein